MKKRLCFILVLMVAVCSLLGCSGKDKGEKTSATGKKVKVTFMDTDGTTVLKETEVEKDTTVESYTPEKEGFQFLGWYGTKELDIVFDFTKAIVRDTIIYANFSKSEVDTKSYVIVGSGTSPVLLSSNWGKTIADEHKMVKTDDTTKNEYTLTLDLYEGDQFQFVTNEKWHFQKGFGYLKSGSIDGVEYFKTSAGLGSGTKKSNIETAVTGNYTFTLTTYPGDDVYDTEDKNYKEDNKDAFVTNPNDTITFTYNGDCVAEKPKMDTVFYIKGSGVTLWKDRFDDRYAMRKDDTGIYTMSIGLKEKETFMFTSQLELGTTRSAGTAFIRYSELETDSQKYFDKDEKYNIIANKTGIYTFKYDESTSKLSAEFSEGEIVNQYDYYVKGTFNNTNWATECNADYQLTVSAEDPYLYQSKPIALAKGDELGLQSLKPGTTSDKVNDSRVDFYNYDFVQDAKEDNNDDNFEKKDNGNISVKKEGTYIITFDSYTRGITFVLSK